jgi:hypothetical protein
MGKAVVFFVKAGATYEADILAGTYYHVKNEEDLRDRKAVLTTLGVAWGEWEGGTDVANPEAFGIKIC